MLCFFFNDTATTEIYTLSLHDALPILNHGEPVGFSDVRDGGRPAGLQDRNSTRLNSSHVKISYAVFCSKKKTNRLIRSTLQKINNECICIFMRVTI